MHAPQKWLVLTALSVLVCVQGLWVDTKKRNYQWTLGHVWIRSWTAYRVRDWCRFHPATQADGILPGDSRYL